MKKLYKLVLMLAFLLQVMGIRSAWAQWVPDGIGICTAANDQNYPQLVSDGAGGAIITWEDWNNFDIYAQRVGANGNADNPPALL